MFQAKPLTFQLESSHVAFTVLYLQGMTFDHYMALLQCNLHSPVLSNWQAFSQEFLSKFGMFDTVVGAKENLFNHQMHNNEQFTTFIIHYSPGSVSTGKENLSGYQRTLSLVNGSGTS
ncbi:hypothetical protein C0993_004954, partial [Termitomyces sp. T159_Od127]